MKQEQKGRSGKAFFLATVGLIFAAILTTVLLANDKRNLRTLLTYLGHPEILQTVEPTPAPVQVRSLRTVRLAARTLIFPTHMFADMRVPQQNFIRFIQSDPRTLCEELSEGGFGDLDWTVSSAAQENWECSSTIVLPAPEGEEAVPSSLFIFIRGDGEKRVTSFRVKLNVENAADAGTVAERGGEAASIFLNQVRWGNADEIITRIKAYQPFDIRNFGSRIQFKREFGEPPRYNFLASQTNRPLSQSAADLYFDRTQWFPLRSNDGTPKIGGMMAGENRDGLPLPPGP
ncbi:DUF6030 family protein [Pararhizobium gei]|uniref:DUF6030 family protein n=1 Tax=Pararhizobium gei TaxID=1395951 RepID=UPI0023DC834F|nr:DUF6030 family protein [Rhizobium gei]